MLNVCFGKQSVCIQDSYFSSNHWDVVENRKGLLFTVVLQGARIISWRKNGRTCLLTWERIGPSALLVCSFILSKCLIKVALIDIPNWFISWGKPTKCLNKHCKCVHAKTIYRSGWWGRANFCFLSVCFLLPSSPWVFLKRLQTIIYPSGFLVISIKPKRK